MSRTDKDKPHWVRGIEHNALPDHDHRYGYCDLAPDPYTEWYEAQGHWSRMGWCKWDNWTVLWHAPCCGYGYKEHYGKEKRAKRRRDRARENAAWRRELAQEPVTGKPRPKGDWRTSCRGKPGKLHQPEIIEAPFYGMSGCHYLSWINGYWHCRHRLVCRRCGKIMKTSLGRECPDFRPS